MNKFLYTIGLLFLLFSCTEKKKQKLNQIIEQEPIRIEFDIKYNDYDVEEDTIHKGETMSFILSKQNLGQHKAPEVIDKIKDTFNVNKIRPGKIYTLFREKNTKKLLYLVYQIDQTTYYLIDLKDSIVAYKKSKPFTYKRKTIAGELDGSLAESLKNYGASMDLTSKLINIYKWSIDFFKSKKGDKFAITYTERFVNDSISSGIENIEATFFEYKDKRIYAFQFVQDTTNGKIEYFDEEGKVLRNFFLKAPLKTINITSRYSKNRFHPVQQIWKAHNGTDYAAPTGTPIMTTASGVVEQTGFTAGNGNFVKVKHDKTYSTQYLHMSKILVKRGQTVKQGDIIGKVGSTGLASGPHVCYRFWKNGVQVDALKLKLPNSQPMSPRNAPRFFEYIAPLKKELDSISTLKLN